jgi:hypothetical protein
VKSIHPLMGANQHEFSLILFRVSLFADNHSLTYMGKIFIKFKVMIDIVNIITCICQISVISKHACTGMCKTFRQVIDID